MGREPDEERKGKRKRKYTLPVICQECGHPAVVAHRNAERVVIRCERCNRRLLAYYTDRERQKRESPPDEEDDGFIRQVEQELMWEAGEAAAALYKYLKRYLAAHGYAPTLREMQAAFGWSSPNAARHHLEKLVAVGLIERDYGASRGLRLVYVA